MDNFKIVADKDLKTKEEIEDRIQSIHRLLQVRGNGQIIDFKGDK